MIELEQVTVCYDDVARPKTVLQEISVELREARIGVIGANGSGKSTFLRLLNGLLAPSSGRVLIGGLDTVDKAREIRRRVGFLFTNPDSQIIMPTVAEDIAFGLRKSKLDDDARSQLVAKSMARFGLTELRDQPAHLLSGGQKQLLALAAVLITSPELLVMDEPTTLLDLRNADLIGRIVAGLDEQVILATHHLDLLDDFERVLLFHDARIVGDGPPAEVIGQYRELLAAEPLPEPGGEHGN